MAGTALVLGGGGVTGAAWELGLLAGLADEGMELTGADLVVGTSAGAIVGAQVTSGASLAGLYQAQLAPPGAEPAPRMGLWVTARWGLAASCAAPCVWPPIRIGGRHWIDGGVRSPTNADLATGSERVVVMAPVARGLTASLAGEVAELTRSSAMVTVVEPDPAAARLIGRNGLDPALRAPAARAGYAQALSAAGQVAAVWPH